MDLVIDELVKKVLQAIAPIIAAGIVAVLGLFARKIGLQISAENQARVEKMAHDAIFLAEEKVTALVKRGVTPMQTKLEMAITHLVDKVPGITVTEAEQIITAELPKLGLGAASFARSVVLAATNDTK